MTKTAGVIIGSAALCAGYMLQATFCAQRPAAAASAGHDTPRRGRLLTEMAQDTSQHPDSGTEAVGPPLQESHPGPGPRPVEPEPELQNASCGWGGGAENTRSSGNGGWGAAATAAISTTSSGSGAGWGVVHVAPDDVHNTNTEIRDPPADVTPTRDASVDASGWAGTATDQPGRGAPAPEAIRRQVHHYFSTRVLLREGDRVMQLIDKDIAQGGRGFVALAELLVFENMKELFAGVATDNEQRLEIVANALRESTQLELSPSERSVRRLEPLPDREKYYAAVAAVENASLAEASDPVLDLAQQQLQQRKPAVDLFHRARADIQHGIMLYVSDDRKAAQQLFHYCRVKMAARGQHNDDGRPVGLGHPMFARDGSCALTRAEREKRGCFWDASRLNIAVCQLSIGVANDNDPEMLTAALRTLQQIRRKGSRLLDVDPTPGDGNLHRDLLDDTVEMLALKASAQIIAAEITLALGQQDQARKYLHDCERVYTAASRRSLAENGTEAEFASLLERRSAELDGSRVGDIDAAAIAIANEDGAGVLIDTQPELDVRPSGNPLGRVRVPDTMINQAFSVWKKHAGHDPLENINASYGTEVGAAVRAACIEAIAFAAFDDVSEQKVFPAQLIRSATADSTNADTNSRDTYQAGLEGQARNFVRRFAEQVLRLKQKSVGENNSRHLVLSKSLSSYRLPLDEDQDVRMCCDCATLGKIGINFTQSQWNKPQSRCKVCTQRQGLTRKRADVERLRAKIAAEDCIVDSVLTYLLKLPTQAAIEACRAKLEEDRKEQERRGFGLRAGFLN